MQHPVVILETDTLALSMLSDLLDREGFEVMEVHSGTSLLQLVEQMTLGVAFLNIGITRNTTARTVQMIRAISPETRIVLTADSEVAQHLPEASAQLGTHQLRLPPDSTEFRALLFSMSSGEVLDEDELQMVGDADQPFGAPLQDPGAPDLAVYTQRPAAPTLPGQRTVAAPQAEPQWLTPSPSQGRNVPQAAPEPPAPEPLIPHRRNVVSAALDERAADLPSAARDAIRAYLEQTFETFMALETRNLELQRDLLKHTDPKRAERLARPLVIWICHPDNEFAEGMKRLAPRLRLDIAAILTTGGEVLDRIADSQPDLLLIGDQLPDIPTDLVIQSVQGSSAATSISIVRGWGDVDRSIELLSQEHGDSITLKLNSVNDLIDVIETVKLNTVAVDMGREFARSFRERHQAFLEDYGRLRAWLDA